MANRSIQAKLLKIKRRGRFAVFSGETAKYAVRMEEQTRTVLYADGKHEERVQIAVGKISLSKAVMSTGRGPDAERMAEYYARVNPDSFLDQPYPASKTVSSYEQILRETPRQNRIRLASDDVAGTLDLFFTEHAFFFVEVHNLQRTIRRSRDYNSKKTAMERLRADRITWVAEIPM